MVALEKNLYQIDVYDMHLPERTNVYLIKEENKIALIETGPTPGIKHILAAIEKLNLSPAQVDFVIVTHIHLDHAGGAGTLLANLPRAKVMVHPRGARHLTEPSRLIAGVKAIYGDKFNSFFEEIVPIDQERIYTPVNGEQLALGPNHRLTFYHTLGHASHHMVIYDDLRKGLFSGDALGVRYNYLSKAIGFDYILPSMPPPEFKPEGLKTTIEQINSLPVEHVFFTHYGQANNLVPILNRNLRLVEKFLAMGQEVFHKGGTAEHIKEKITAYVKDELAGYGIKNCQLPVFQQVLFDLDFNAQGIFHYLVKR
jgi:glyoxylase-like metal-dependent hydrolase (beta-lactamase superfamily II)